MKGAGFESRTHHFFLFFICLSCDKKALEIKHILSADYILKRKSFATLIKCKFLLIGSNISFGDITTDKSSSLPLIQYENQSSAAYGCRENVKTSR